jgi:penicillin-binding protein 2
LAFLKHGIDPDETIFCNGGYRLGNRVFKCLGHHGTMNLPNAIMKSCNTYFYSMGRRIGYDKIAPVAKELGLGNEFELPFPSQRYGTIPDSVWKMKKYGKEWSDADTLNATIGQGYVSVSPFQLAVMAARIASGRNITPEIILKKRKPAPLLSFPPEHLAIVREGMNRVVNGAGTAVRSRIDIDGVKMGGKTGTAQVRRIEGAQRGQSGVWKYRDHGLFVCFAPVDAPRYGAAVVIEHGLGGARAAAPVAKDVLTFLFDRDRAMASLNALEAGWGGSLQERTAKDFAAYQTAATTPAPIPGTQALPATNATASPNATQPTSELAGKPVDKPVR